MGSSGGLRVPWGSPEEPQGKSHHGIQTRNLLEIRPSSLVRFDATLQHEREREMTINFAVWTQWCNYIPPPPKKSIRVRDRKKESYDGDITTITYHTPVSFD